jgi:acetyl esterase/lipase
MPADNPNRLSRRTVSAGLIALVTDGCSRLGFLAANVPASFGAYKRHANIAYGVDPQQRLDVYAPQRSAPMLRPVVIFWHGGRWSFGDKADYKFVGAALAQCGYVAVLPNYRHYPQVRMAGFMEDAACAAVWASLHASDFGGDESRLYLMGHSAGAHMAALVALDPRYFAALGQSTPRIAGVIGLSGPYDFLPLRESDVQDMFGPPPDYAQSQPINFVRRDAPPMLLLHGLDDVTVLPKNSRNLATALNAAGGSATLKLYPKRGHADTIAALATLARGRAPTRADILTFVGPAPA